MKSIRFLLLAVVVSMTAMVSPQAGAQAQRRVALVLANGGYPGNAALGNPRNDGELMARTLRQLGFSVDLQMDLQRRPMREALARFADQASGAQAALVYYAGHGVQVGGFNYLVPVDPARPFPTDEADIVASSIRADEIVEKLGARAGRINIVILDACRDNPFSTSYRSVAPGRAGGLAMMEAPVGTLIAYSTAPGRRARDGGAGGNSIYTAVLARQMLSPGQPIEQMFKSVRARVAQETQDSQVPWESTSLVGDFRFLPASEASPAVAAAPPRAAEATGLPPAPTSAPTPVPPTVTAARNPTSPAASPKNMDAGQGADFMGRMLAASAAPPDLRTLLSGLQAILPTQPDARLVVLEQQAASLDPTTAVKQLRRGAGAGDTDAQVLMGLLLTDKRNTRPAAAEARTWWQAAASRGDAGAQLLLAQSLLQQADASPVDTERARALLRSARQAGSQRAASALGRNGDRP